MTNKRAILLSIVVILLGFIITAGSYAFWSWTSNVNKNVVFNTASNLRNYIISNWFAYLAMRTSPIMYREIC